MGKSNFRILAIETSCDETAAAVVESAKGKTRLLSNIIASQEKIHARTGGVVPETAARLHVKKLILIIRRALGKTLRVTKDNKGLIKDVPVDAIAVTAGPGLLVSLLVGVETAKTLAWAWGKPLIAVNHLEGHIYAALSQIPKSKFQNLNSRIFPAIALLVSGGHTELILISNLNPPAGGQNSKQSTPKYTLIGETLDDAAGECFDKTARILGLGYPGGPAIALAAAKAQTLNSKFKTHSKISLPRPMLNSPDLNFSFSGLKTALLYKWQKLKKPLPRAIINILAAEVQQVIIDVLTLKTIRAAKKYQAKMILVGGGVSANSLLRETMKNEAEKIALPCFFPPRELSTDNAVMIGLAAVDKYLRQEMINWRKIKADSNLKLKTKN